MKKLYASLLGLFLFLPAWAQNDDPVQLSGMVLTADSVPQAIPFAHASVLSRGKGTNTDAEGFFSFAALPGDTVRFSAVGFRKEELYVPDTLELKEYLVKIVMKRDTTLLQEVTLYPWPTPDQFNEAFLRKRIPTTDEDIARRNLAIQALKDRAYAMGYSPEEIQDYVIQSQATDIANYGRYQGFGSGGSAILGSLSNPFAWAQLFESIKNGDFKSNTPRKRN